MENRKYPRFRFNAALAEALPTLAGQVVWPNLEASRILDLSYRGFAVEIPGLQEAPVGARVKLAVELGAQPRFMVNAEVVWLNATLIGLRAEARDAVGTETLNRYWHAKEISRQMKRIDNSLFHPQADFDDWYQGPSDTHVFVRRTPEGCVASVRVDCAGELSEWARGRGVPAEKPEYRLASLVLSQMDRPELPMEDFLRSLGG